MNKIYDILIDGIKLYCKENGFKKIVVGCSGGLDSAVVLALARDAIGSENVIAITMPSRFSSVGSIIDSEQLCENLGIKLLHYPIQEEVELSIRQYKKHINEEVKRLTIENIQARIRGKLLMTFSNNEGALILNTGNKSEIMVGYFTLFGDSVGFLAPLGSLYKTQVIALAKYINLIVENIPYSIINKKPSAELWDGQTDEDSLGEYEKLDAVLERIERKEPVSASDYEIKIRSLVKKNMFKRRFLPESINIIY